MSTGRLAESVESLNSSLAVAAGDLWPKKGARGHERVSRWEHGVYVQDNINLVY